MQKEERCLSTVSVCSPWPEHTSYFYVIGWRVAFLSDFNHACLLLLDFFFHSNCEQILCRCPFAPTPCLAHPDCPMFPLTWKNTSLRPVPSSDPQQHEERGEGLRLVPRAQTHFPFPKGSLNPHLSEPALLCFPHQNMALLSLKAFRPF